jgi:hypothetical protein
MIVQSLLNSVKALINPLEALIKMTKTLIEILNEFLIHSTSENGKE